MSPRNYSGDNMQPLNEHMFDKAICRIDSGIDDLVTDIASACTYGDAEANANLFETTATKLANELPILLLIALRYKLKHSLGETNGTS
jgi:hypothetical protein